MDINRSQLKVYWTVPIESVKPWMVLYWEGKISKGIIDTGADVSIIRTQLVPTEWVLTAGPTVKGVGGSCLF